MDPLNSPATPPDPASETRHATAMPMRPRTTTTGMSTGRPWPLGAQVDDDGVNFALASSAATAVELCVFDDTGSREIARHRLPGRTHDVWHGHLPGARPGLIYGWRVHGPWRPAKGHRFNPNKVLLDPYAREIVGDFHWGDEHFGADRVHPQHMDFRDNAATALKARVVSPLQRQSVDEPLPRPPRVPAEDTVLYELHVKGFTRCMPGVPEALRGTYAGLASDAAIAHLTRLGVTTLSLLPVHAHLDEERLVDLGLSNYWGYNTIGFFAPHAAYAASGASGARAEFRDMVRRLHAAGFEVLIDVVYNHTAEGAEDGPTLCWRGIDHATAYRLRADDPSRCENWTGCGNTVDVRQPRMLQMIADSLRHWAGEMEVDGFRFDLAPILGRGDAGFDPRSPFFTVVAQDPVLSRLKMIAEPWDIGPDGWQVGAFPRGWLEWNDRFRDGQRAFWLGAGPGGPRHASTRGDFALRLCGSSDLYEARRRNPCESVNYVASHDGFTLHDLLTWEVRRNEANGEDNRDGHGLNLGWNCGVEGESDDPVVRRRRARLSRTLLACTVLAQGTPMLCAGDELGRSQQGNNNAYCHDSPVSWVDWSAADEDLIAFTARVIALRHKALPFGNRWYSGLTDSNGLHDLGWMRADGSALEGSAWRDPSSRLLGCLIGQPGRAKAPLLILVNGEAEDHPFQLPAGVWQALLDTSHPRGEASFHGQGEVPYWLPAHSLSVLAAAGAGLLPRDLAPVGASERSRPASASE
jgi:glycogen debranching enzyme GlgX